MKCINCQHEIREGSEFCPLCGTLQTINQENEFIPEVQNNVPVKNNQADDNYEDLETPIPDASQTNIPVNNQVIYQESINNSFTSNPIFSNFLDRVKSFFSSDVTSTISKASKSKTHEWVVFLAITSIFFALSLATIICHGMRSLINALLSLVSFLIGGYIPNLTDSAMSNVSFFGIFGLSLLLAVIVFFALSLMIKFVLSLMYKINAGFIEIFNMVSYASVLLAFVYIINILFAFIYIPITIISFIVSIMITGILLYIGIQRFDKMNKTPLWGMIIILSVTVIVAILFSYWFINIEFNSIVHSVSNQIIG